jgi:hypothetical protein
MFLAVTKYRSQIRAVVSSLYFYVRPLMCRNQLAHGQLLQRKPSEALRQPI